MKANPLVVSSAEKDVEDIIKHWLRMAPKRNGEKKEREERKRRNAMEDGADIRSTRCPPMYMLTCQALWPGGFYFRNKHVFFKA